MRKVTISVHRRTASKITVNVHKPSYLDYIQY